MARDTAGFTWPPGPEDKVESEGRVQHEAAAAEGERRYCVQKEETKKQKKGRKDLNYCLGFQIQLAKIERKKMDLEKNKKTWLGQLCA